MSRNKTFDINEAISKAINVFWEKGYEGTSMQDIVDALGLSRSSIYETFGNKKNLFLAALDLYEDNANDSLTAILYEEGTAKELLVRYFNRVIEHTRLRSCLLLNTSLELTADSKVTGRANSSRIKSEQAFYQLLTKAKSNMEIKGNPDLRALSQYLVNIKFGIAVTVITADDQTMENIVKVSLYFLR